MRVNHLLREMKAAKKPKRPNPVRSNIEPAPISVRCHDWQAWLDGQEERGSGTGRTEKEAVLDLLEKIPELPAVPAKSLQNRIAAAIRTEAECCSEAGYSDAENRAIYFRISWALHRLCERIYALE